MEDKNSNMRMFNISRIDDLVANSMKILEPASVDADGNAREDGIQVDLYIFSFYVTMIIFFLGATVIHVLHIFGFGYDDVILRLTKYMKKKKWKLAIPVSDIYRTSTLTPEFE